jgi:hypothetical protein
LRAGVRSVVGWVPSSLRRGVVIVVLAGGLGLAARAAAQPAPTATSSLVMGGLTLARPAALPTGMATGVDAAFVRGARFGWGVRASWATATEYTLTRTVRNDDVRLRLTGVLQHAAGRGTFGLRLGLGGTLVHESRTRSQGSRAGLTGEDLETTAWAMLPAADLEVTVALRILGAWGVTLSGGPSLHLLHGDALFGWVSSLGVAWQY